MNRGRSVYPYFDRYQERWIESIEDEDCIILDFNAEARRTCVGSIYGQFEAIASFRYRHLMRAAGFYWDPKGKYWFTTDPEAAAMLERFATDNGQRAIREAQEEMDGVLHRIWRGFGTRYYEKRMASIEDERRQERECLQKIHGCLL